MIDALVLWLERIHGRYAWRRYWRDTARAAQRQQHAARMRECDAEYNRNAAALHTAQRKAAER